MTKLQMFPKISQNVIKRYEPSLDRYFFYNAKNKTFWNCDSSIGAVISCLDGTVRVDKILDIISENNPETDRESIVEKISETLDFLLKEGFVYEAG